LGLRPSRNGAAMLDLIIDELNGSFTGVPATISAIRLLEALVLGGIVGWEREKRDKPAGLRTHMLVSIAACLFVLVGVQLGSVDFGPQERMRIDPLRLIEAVTAGVAFLAAGLIFTSGGQVRNVTTGASLWLCGAIGLACGAGQGTLAGMATALVVLVLALIGSYERRRARKAGEGDG